MERLTIDGVKLSDEPLYMVQGARFYQDKVKFALHKFAFYECYQCKAPYYGGDHDCANAAVQDGAGFDRKELLCSTCSPVQASNCAKHGREFVTWKCRYCCNVAMFFCWGTTHFCQACHANSLELGGTPRHLLTQCPCLPVGESLPSRWTGPAKAPAGETEAGGGEERGHVHDMDDGNNTDGDDDDGDALCEKKQKEEELSTTTKPGSDENQMTLSSMVCPLLGVVHPPSGYEFCLGCTLCNETSVHPTCIP